MPRVSVTLLLTVCFIFLARVTASPPPWLNKEYKFSCRPICSKYSKGETLSCMLGSPYGLSGGEVILRILPNLDWRYYRIDDDDDGNEKELCKSIMAADHFYYNGNKTLCHAGSYKNQDYDDVKASFSQDHIKPLHGYNDGRTDALCFWATRDMCQKKHMVVCDHDVCCWRKVDTKLCGQISSDDTINKYREHLFTIIQNMIAL